MREGNGGGYPGAGADQHRRNQDPADGGIRGGGEQARRGHPDAGCHAELVGQRPGVPGAPGEGLHHDSGDREEGHHGACDPRGDPGARR